MRCFFILSTLLFFVKICNFYAHHGLMTVLVSMRLMLGTTSLGFTIFGHVLFPKRLRNFFFALFSVKMTTTRATMTLTVVVGICHGCRDSRIGDVRGVGFWGAVRCGCTFLVLLLPFLDFLILKLINVGVGEPMTTLVNAMLVNYMFTVSICATCRCFFTINHSTSANVCPAIAMFGFA